jgi:hypothetical protein
MTVILRRETVNAWVARVAAMTPLQRSDALNDRSLSSQLRAAWIAFCAKLDVEQGRNEE